MKNIQKGRALRLILIDRLSLRYFFGFLSSFSYILYAYIYMAPKKTMHTIGAYTNMSRAYDLSAK